MLLHLLDQGLESRPLAGHNFLTCVEYSSHNFQLIRSVSVDNECKPQTPAVKGIKALILGANSRDYGLWGKNVIIIENAVYNKANQC